MRHTSINRVIKTAIICVSLVLGACDDFLDTPSNSVFTEETTFSNLDFAQKELFSVYSTLTSGSLYGDLLFYAHSGSDIELTKGTGESKYPLSNYQATESNKDVGNIWITAYSGIERANICIDNLPISPIWDGQYAKEAKALYGEAVALRALFYYELVSIFGDVPFTVHSTQSGDNFYLPKTDRDEIYEYLIEDLRKVEDYVPWMTNTAERVTKGFVKGLRARMALAYAGFSLRNKTFETRRGRHWEAYYQIANQECREIVASGPHKLNPDFTDVFKSKHAYKQDLTYKETLFEIAFGRGNSTAGGRVTYLAGMKISKDANAGMSTEYGRATPVIYLPFTYYYTFDRQDVRRDVSAELYNYNNGNAVNQQAKIGTGEFTPTKWRRSWLEPKMGGDVANVAFDGVNWPIMRYADILLMLAETENEIHPTPTAEAKDALRQVRERAFPQSTWDDHVTAYLNGLSTKVDFFDAIVNERGWEFGGEFLRKFDLVRWNLLGEKLDQVRTDYQRVINHDPAFEHVPDYLYTRFPDAERIEILPDYQVLPDGVLGKNNATYLLGEILYTRNNWVLSGNAGTAALAVSWANTAVPGYDPKGYVRALNNHLLPLSSTTITNSNGALSNDQIPPK